MIAWNNVKCLVDVKSMKKIFWGPNLGPKLGILLFSQVWLISFLEIAYNDSSQQFITSNRGKIRIGGGGGGNFWARQGETLGQTGEKWVQNFVSLVFL